MKFYIHIYIIVYLKCLKGTHTRILIYILHMCIYICYVLVVIWLSQLGETNPETKQLQCNSYSNQKPKHKT